MSIRYRYTGDGAFLPGIPARDLTDEDVQALTPEQRAEVEASAIYEAVAPTATARRSAPVSEEE